MENKILHLSLKKEWFQLIESGIKIEEYRELKEYWLNRLLKNPKPEDKGFWANILRKSKKAYNKFPFLTLKKQLIEQFGVKPYTHVCFRYGYTQKTITFKIKEITIGIGNKEWGAPDEDVFIIKLGEKYEENN